MEWIARTDRMPDSARPVLVMMDAGSVRNPMHPGHKTGGKWVEISSRGEAMGGAVLMDVFVTELCQSGQVTHWADLPALQDGRPASAEARHMVNVREFCCPELESLREFHDFFLDKSEGLYSLYGWPAIELLNDTAAARRGELAKPRRPREERWPRMKTAAWRGFRQPLADVKRIWRWFR